MYEIGLYIQKKEKQNDDNDQQIQWCSCSSFHLWKAPLDDVTVLEHLQINKNGQQSETN